MGLLDGILILWIIKQNYKKYRGKDDNSNPPHGDDLNTKNSSHKLDLLVLLNHFHQLF